MSTFGTPPEPYGDSRIYTYTNLTIPSDVKQAILAKLSTGWFEPRLRPGQNAYERECTPFIGFSGVEKEVEEDMNKPCNILVVRGGFGTIVGLCIWTFAPGDYHFIRWLVSDRPGLGRHLVQKVVDHAYAKADATQELQIILVVSRGYKLAASAAECNDVPVFNVDWYWIRMGFQLSENTLSGYDFERRVLPRVGLDRRGR